MKIQYLWWMLNNIFFCFWWKRLRKTCLYCLIFMNISFGNKKKDKIYSLCRLNEKKIFLLFLTILDFKELFPYIPFESPSPKDALSLQLTAQMSDNKTIFLINLQSIKFVVFILSFVYVSYVLDWKVWTYLS